MTNFNIKNTIFNLAFTIKFGYLAYTSAYCTNFYSSLASHIRLYSILSISYNH